MADLTRLIRVLVILACVIVLQAHAATYVYDANGRLRAVTSSTGGAREYIYDALGNLYAIDDVPTSQLAIFAFTPGYGPAGQSVSISGQGFSPIASNDTVRFNGAVATVVSATTSEIVALVPASATTGPISVEVGSISATSIDDYVVEVEGLPPIVTTFSPKVVSRGAVVSVVGSGFRPPIGSTSAGVGFRTNPVVPSSDTQLSLTVPQSAGSGLVTVVTTYGEAQSSSPLIVLPSGVSPSNVLSSADLTVGTPQGFVINTASKYAAATFPGSAGQWLTLHFSSLTTTPSGGTIAVTVYDPTLTSIASGTVPVSGVGGMSIHLPKLYFEGTYLVLMKASKSSNFSLVVEGDRVIGITQELNVATSFALSKRLVVAGAAGISGSIAISELQYIPSGSPGSAYYKSFDANGASIEIQGCASPGCHYVLKDLPSTGNDSVWLSTNSTQDVSFTAAFISAEMGSLETDVPYPLDLVPGKVAMLTFDGVVGEHFAVSLANIISAGNAEVTVYYPPPYNMVKLVDHITVLGSAGIVNLPNLTATGKFSVQVEGRGLNGLASEVTLLKNPTHELTIDEWTPNLQTSVPGENIYFTYLATAGEKLSVAVYTPSPAIPDRFTLTVYDPTGAQKTNQGNCYPSGCHIALDATSPGTYVVAAKAHAGTLHTLAATISADLLGTLVDGSPYAVGLTHPGQIGRLEFAGTSGAHRGIYLENISTSPSGGSIVVSVKGPTGLPVASGTFTTIIPAGTLDLPNLTAAGTYTVQVDPQDIHAANVNVTLLVPSTTSINGPPIATSITSDLQYQYFLFSGSTGQNVSVAISDLVIVGYGGFAYAVYSPTGTLLASRSCGAPGCVSVINSLPANGNYLISLHPNGVGTDVSFSLGVTSP